MLVALTYDLKQRYLDEGYSPSEVAELDSPVTIDAIDDALKLLGFETERIGSIFDLVSALALGKRWDVVFNIAEGLHGLCRESQIPALLDAYRIPYVFSDSFVLGITLHKALAKSIVRQKGVPTPDYVFIERLEDAEDLDLAYPVFIKPISGGTGMGIDGDSIAYQKEQLIRKVKSLLSVYTEGVLIETYLSGREFTVGIVGTGEAAKVIGMMEIVAQDGVYSYQSKQNYLEDVKYEAVDPAIAEACAHVALGAWNALLCRDGGRVDVKMDGHGVVHFLEVNPLAGLHPIDSDLPILSRMAGIEYSDLIGMIMESALMRIEREKA